MLPAELNWIQIADGFGCHKLTCIKNSVLYRIAIPINVLHNFTKETGFCRKIWPHLYDSLKSLNGLDRLCGFALIAAKLK